MKTKRSVINNELKILIPTMRIPNQGEPLFVLTQINTILPQHRVNLRPSSIVGHKQSLAGFINLIRMRYKRIKGK